ncbi:16S rRNA (adenine(1518)-N(6)/adenine(1519)-N(6))-dimethyltransferase RsmA [Buchnera aphidicola (Muscaphis stroyani)]|uniref:Ribosomal RNA small subunit methyltransferase A n=1 Tax=Buchnera aphidicola (Muscaphis stroyani) TaxID=1241869 RepID=A0A4D6YF72_9GAMM|nr:16S rRNA (adenine(1518)-N(6)/adenine(1519)-N(6))-dimethyltransferase RsmA [Buchnera aphidicola]QCI24240.1 16S rRNA (adenine(1518)-N(6)/adenine(1519)-N(6))-dimethyltransferase RsmA [Buchnera aphidicola (Muscaphis stroyani)]
MILKKAKYFPKKKLGQNFLINKKIVQDIVNIINPKITQILVEIGPGFAALTKPICKLVNNLIVIEIDATLLKFLEKQSFYSKLIIFCQDALRFDYLNLYHQKKNIRIFGNLPYNISTSLIIHLLNQIHIVEDMHFMLQKEVADRLTATPGNKSYGRLSIITQYYCKVKTLLKVSAKNFLPIPKVDSAFVSLIPHTNHPYFLYNINTLSYITNIAFQKRRKMIRHSLSNVFTEQLLIRLGINPELRAENITINQYCQLSNYFFNHIKRLKI